MSEQTSQEPTMEKILSPTRRIISEDDAPGGEEGEAAPAEPEAVAAAAPEPEPQAEPEPEPAAVAPEPVVAAAPEPEPEPAVEEEALELTEKVETHGDLDVFTAPAAEPVAAEPTIESLVSERAASAAASSFGQLSAAIGMPRSD